MPRIDVDGAAVMVADAGRGIDPQRPSVAWLHGAGMDRSVWMMQARDAVFADVNSLAIDLPLHGASAGPALTSIQAMAAWTARTLEHLGLGRTLLVGHSMGALIALETAHRLADRLAGLALLGAASAMPVAPALLEAARANDPKAATMVATWGVGRSSHLGSRHSPGVFLTSAAERLVANAKPGVLALDLAACDAWRPDRLESIACPTLVVAGSEDRMTPAKRGRELAAAIAGAQFETIDGAGHMMMLEEPLAVLSLIAAFAERALTSRA